MKPFYFARIVLVTLSCIYACAVCTSGNDGAMVDLTQPTEPRYDHPQCSIFEKTKPSNNIRFNTKRKDWAQCSIFEKTKPSNKIRFNTKRKDWGEIPKSKMGWHEIYFQLQMNWPIMPAYPPMLEGTYYAWNYASIICECLVITTLFSPIKIFQHKCIKGIFGHKMILSAQI